MVRVEIIAYQIIIIAFAYKYFSDDDFIIRKTTFPWFFPDPKVSKCINYIPNLMKNNSIQSTILNKEKNAIC